MSEAQLGDGASTRFIDAIFNGNQEFREEVITGELVSTFSTDGVSTDVHAELGVYEEPVVYLATGSLQRARQGVEIRAAQRAISSLSLEQRADDKGFTQELPELDGLEVDVVDQFGNRRYYVPDSPERDVTVSFLSAESDEEGFSSYGEPTPVEATDASTMRRLVDHALSALA